MFPVMGLPIYPALHLSLELRELRAALVQRRAPENRTRCPGDHKMRGVAARAAPTGCRWPLWCYGGGSHRVTTQAPRGRAPPVPAQPAGAHPSTVRAAAGTTGRTACRPAGAPCGVGPASAGYESISAGYQRATNSARARAGRRASRWWTPPERCSRRERSRSGLPELFAGMPAQDARDLQQAFGSPGLW